MPRYMVVRTFPNGLDIPATDAGEAAVGGVVKCNTTKDVTWIHSYVSKDKKQTFCIYDGPDENAIRAVAKENGLPVDSVTEVRVLDPYFFH
ncbi:MAG: DUF4242 domain-containing protein [Candidatus Eremiobacteraeota bacterium]|nr:DUF4242 domain-containing protein [Candidatus Eremiobacteraeota bacterium]MBV8222938.1 DUF4242 domain-containing protein [Candidatus Eremiobacteraeota bacterium]MBV8280600.1 DUF4242 domain-containing protein [Candidatus Eremiobacteraeota bacterium]